jgi:LacI family transcriptional regulator
MRFRSPFQDGLESTFRDLAHASDCMARNPDPSPLQQIVTLAMVADAAGVSPSTVSRILTGNARVSDDKRAAVEEAIAELKYQPNVLARGLAQGRTLSIGVLTQDINSPFYGEALRGIEDELVGTGIVPLFVSGHWNLQDELERMSHLLSRRVDGVIVLTGRLPDEQIREYAQRVPIVVAGRTLKGHNIASMRVDDFKGALRATQHLVDADFHEASGLTAINQLLDARQAFTAVFASNDQSAYGARLALYQRDIRVPEDVSLIGFEDLPGSRYAIPPLSTIHQPVYELGHAAARVLLKLIEGGKSRVTLPEPQLVARESTRKLGG